MNRLFYYWKNFAKKQLKSLILSLIILSLLVAFSMLSLYIQIFAQKWIREVKNETYISVFYEENLNVFSKETIMDSIFKIKGVGKVREISAEEAYADMKAILGEDADLLSLYDETVFLPYFQVDIELDLRKEVVKQIGQLENIIEVKDNQEVLDVIQKVTTVTFYSTLILFAALISVTSLIIYFIVNEIIKKSAQDIETYALLGGMPYYVGWPYVSFILIFSTITSGFGSLLFKLAMTLFDTSLFKFMTLNSNRINENFVWILVSFIVLVLSSVSSIYAFKTEYKKYL